MNQGSGLGACGADVSTAWSLRVCCQFFPELSIALIFAIRPGSR